MGERGRSSVWIADNRSNATVEERGTAPCIVFLSLFDDPKNAMNPVEIEMKFLIPPGGQAVIEELPRIAAVPPRRERLVSTYFDTPSLALRDQGLRLRVRREPRGWIQTLKRAGASFGVRNEWEWRLQDERPDFSRLQEASLDMALVTTINRQARPVFVTDIERTEREVRGDHESIVQAAIDEGAAVAGNASAGIHEIELELKGGPLSSVFHLATDLLACAPLRINPTTKADTGYALATGGGPESEKSKVPDLSRRMPVAAAFPALVGNALHHFVANIPAAEAGQVEGVHQMRVALRRLRTLFVLFAPEIESFTRDRLSNAMRDLATPLGAARDWDVFITETLASAEQAGVRSEWIASLRDVAEIRRQDAHESVKQLLAGKKPTELVIAVGTWVTGPEWAGLDRQASERKLNVAMPDLLDRLRRKVRKRGRGMPDLTGEAMHSLRKSVKKLRYSVEYARPLYRKRKVKAYAKRCKALQSALGTINDAVVTGHLIDAIAQRSDIRAAPAAGVLTGWNETRCGRAHREAARAWNRLCRSSPFWT